MTDPMLRGVINSSRRTKGWMTSADVFDRDKLRHVGREGAAEIERLVAAYKGKSKP